MPGRKGHYKGILTDSGVGVKALFHGSRNQCCALWETNARFWDIRCAVFGFAGLNGFGNYVIIHDDEVYEHVQ